jgi:hypothetical protein
MPPPLQSVGQSGKSLKTLRQDGISPLGRLANSPGYDVHVAIGPQQLFSPLTRMSCEGRIAARAIRDLRRGISSAPGSVRN